MVFACCYTFPYCIVFSNKFFLIPVITNFEEFKKLSRNAQGYFSVNARTVFIVYIRF